MEQHELVSIMAAILWTGDQEAYEKSTTRRVEDAVRTANKIIEEVKEQSGRRLLLDNGGSLKPPPTPMPTHGTPPF